jgi:hypothetical protein
MARECSIRSVMRPHSVTGLAVLNCAVFILLGVVGPLILFLNSDGGFSIDRNFDFRRRRICYREVRWR